MFRLVFSEILVDRKDSRVSVVIATRFVRRYTLEDIDAERLNGAAGRITSQSVIEESVGRILILSSPCINEK